MGVEPTQKSIGLPSPPSGLQRWAVAGLLDPARWGYAPNASKPASGAPRAVHGGRTMDAVFAMVRRRPNRERAHFPGVDRTAGTVVLGDG